MRQGEKNTKKELSFYFNIDYSILFVLHSFTGNHDRAWNDPPKFAFNASSGGGQGGPAGRRRLLNKRVAVPIGPVPPAVASPMRLVPNSVQ